MGGGAGDGGVEGGGREPIGPRDPPSPGGGRGVGRRPPPPPRGRWMAWMGVGSRTPSPTPRAVDGMDGGGPLSPTPRAVDGMDGGGQPDPASAVVAMTSALSTRTGGGR